MPKHPEPSYLPPADTVPLLHPHQPPTICYGVPVVLLHRTRLHRPRHCSSLTLLPTLLLFLLALAAFLLFPSNPSLRVARLHLLSIRVRTSPSPTLDVALHLRLRVRNPDFYELEFREIRTSIWYRGERLGVVVAGGGRVRARGVSYVEAELVLDGIRVLHDVFYLIEDLARGKVPFETVTEIDGTVHAFFLDVPINGKLSCSVNVDPNNQTVIDQDCY